MRSIKQIGHKHSTHGLKQVAKHGSVLLSCLAGFYTSTLLANISNEIPNKMANQQASDVSKSIYIDPKSTQQIERMQNVIAWHQEIVNRGGWQQLNLDDVLALGSEGPFVAELVNRLVLGGDLTEDTCKVHIFTNPIKDISPCVFDIRVEDAVKRFQQRHGLLVDGVVGRKTLRHLNVPAKIRYAQLKLNFQRMTEFPGRTDEEYVLVNIPEFKLRYINKGDVVLKNRVVVGKPSWKTPAFSDEIEKFVVNPTWRIPLSIATREIAPKVANDPDYLEKKNIEIREHSYLDKNLIDPDKIVWDEIEPYDFEHFLVKRAGKDNPLGEIKYLFPNVNAIYIHDTKAKNWFKKPKRAASHGCIRMERPFSLAKAIIKQHQLDGITPNIENVRTTDKTRTFHLQKPVPIHLVYWTAWVDENNTVNFRTDIYNQDKNIHLLHSTEPMIAANHSLNNMNTAP